MKHRISYANVMSTLAVFIALGGTSYAVARNSIGTRELKPNAVTSPKIRNGSVTAADLAGSLSTGPRGPRGPAGPAGSQGGLGPQGQRGPSDVLSRVRRTAVSLPGVASGTADIVDLDNVPPGNWLFIATGSAVYEGAGASGASYFRCRFVFDTTEGDARAVAAIGQATAATGAASMDLYEARTLTRATTVHFRCGHDVALGGNPRFDHAQVVAVRTDGLQIQAPQG